MPKTTSVVIAGLGGQGVLKASDLLAEVAFRAGLDVKKSEIHGMSQRGGSVASDVRFGDEVCSPMVPPGEADYVLVLADEELATAKAALRPGGILITREAVDASRLPSARSLNIALLGALNRHLGFPARLWHEAIRAKLKETLHEANLAAFEAGSQA